MEYLKTSTKFVQQLENCNHYMHLDCLSQCLKKGMNNCPMCGMSVKKCHKNIQKNVTYCDNNYFKIYQIR